MAKKEISEEVKIENVSEMTIEEALKIVETPNVKIRREGLHEGSRSANQLKYYATHEFARTILPKGAGDPKDAVETYCVNDLMFFILKGVGVKLPMDVVMGFEQAATATTMALEKDSLKNTPKELEV